MIFARSHVCSQAFSVYVLQTRKDVEGSMFLIRRRSEPFMQLIILNKKSQGMMFALHASARWLSIAHMHGDSCWLLHVHWQPIYAATYPAIANAGPVKARHATGSVLMQITLWRTFPATSNLRCRAPTCTTLTS